MKGVDTYILYDLGQNWSLDDRLRSLRTCHKSQYHLFAVVDTEQPWTTLSLTSDSAPPSAC